MPSKESDIEPRPTFTELLRYHFGGLIDPVAAFLNRLGVYPNTVTLAGLAGNLVGSIFIARGNFLVGGLIVLAMGPIDALDGAIARIRGEPTAFGAFVDSVTDRYSELIILGGLLAYYLLRSDLVMAGVVYAAAAGSVLVSYVKARAESVGYESKGGILTRIGRYLVLAPSLVLGYPQVGAVIVAALANVTALQRIIMVRRQARRK